MERTPVTSSDLAEVGYDRDTMTLEVEFHNGAIYQYFDVPDAVYQELMGAASKGRFFNANVKNSFRCAKL